MNIVFQRTVLIAAAGALVAVAGYSGYKIHVLSREQAAIKKDYSNVNSIGSGMLSVEVWKEQIMKAADYQLSHFELDENQKDTLEVAITKILNSVITKADTLKPKSFGGKIKKAVAEAFIDKKKLRARVPEFSRTIVNEMLKYQNKQKIKYLVDSKLKQLANTTYDSTQTASTTDTILKKYSADSISVFNSHVEETTARIEGDTYTYTYVALGVMILFLGAWLLLRKQYKLHRILFAMSIALAVAVLVVGLTTPMIEIDARIKSIDFHLIGQHVVFKDQVIFFQSKSITDVVQLLLKTGKYDSVLVGVLILVFSIVFPFAKLLSEGVFLFTDRFRKIKVISFFAFKSGKWSMADVNVIAIFMAYIGFKGILDDQLKSINVTNDALTAISTNKTSLQPGYILFVGFVLFSLMLAIILERIMKNEKVKIDA